MIDLALANLYLLGAALVIGIVTARWALPKQKPAEPETREEDEAQP